MVTPPQLRLTSHHDIVVAVPYLLGFHPQDSLVCIVLDNRRVRFVARIDLTDPGDLSAPAAHAATLVTQYGSAVILVGYGTSDLVEPAAHLVTAAMHATGIGVLHVLHVTGGHIHCLCGDPDCSRDATPYDPATSVVPAEAVYLGIAPLPDRAAVGQLITPISGPDRDRMRYATDNALQRLADMLTRHGVQLTGGQPPALPEHILTAGITALQQAYQDNARGDRLSDGEVAWLTAVLMIPEVCEYAWTTCDGSDEQRRLWIDVTRRAMPPADAAPPCLLAITAYLAGDGALANIAVDRSLQTDPDYPLAQLLARVLHAGLPPQLWQAATRTTTD